MAKPPKAKPEVAPKAPKAKAAPAGAQQYAAGAKIEGIVAEHINPEKTIALVDVGADEPAIANEGDWIVSDDKGRRVVPAAEYEAK